MTIAALFDNALWFQLGATLLHFLWQGVVIAILIRGVVHLYELRHGAARYNAYLLGLILMAAAPIVTFSILHGSGADFSRSDTQKTQRIILNRNGGLAPPSLRDLVVLEVRVPEQIRPESRLREAAEWCLAQGKVFIEPAIPLCLVFWSLGVFVLSVRLIFGHGQTVFWRFRAAPLPEDFLERVQRLARRFGFKHFQAIYRSDHVREALAVGILRPMILLPTAWMAQMDPEMLQAVVAHELAHIRRHDLWVNLFQRIVETLLFYHPAVWWISKSIRSEREYCCDQEAADVIAGRATYADALHRAGQLKLQSFNALAAGFGTQSDGLLNRVQHVLGGSGSERGRQRWLAGLLSLSTMGMFVAPPVATFASHMIQPSVVRGTEHGSALKKLLSRTIRPPMKRRTESGSALKRLLSENIGDHRMLQRLLREERMDQAALMGILDSIPKDAESLNQLAMRGLAGYRVNNLSVAEESLLKVLNRAQADSALHIQCSFFLAKTYKASYQPRKARALLETCFHSDRALVPLTKMQRLQVRQMLGELSR